MKLQERRKNAEAFFKHVDNFGEKAFVVKRITSKNPHVNRVQFLTAQVGGSYYPEESPMVIAESPLGIQGAFDELIEAVCPQGQKKYYEDNFPEWFSSIGYKITYQDGFVFMIKKEER